MMGAEVEKSIGNVVWLWGSGPESNPRLSFSTAPSPLIQMTEPGPPFSPGKEVLATEQKAMLTTEEWEMKTCLELW